MKSLNVFFTLVLVLSAFSVGYCQSKDTHILIAGKWISKPHYNLSDLKEKFDGNKRNWQTDVSTIRYAAESAGIDGNNAHGCLHHWKGHFLGSKDQWLNALVRADANNDWGSAVIGIYWGFWKGYITDADLRNNQ